MPFLVCIGPYCQPACRTYALLGKPGETALHLLRVATVGNVLISDPLLIIRPLFPQVQCRISQLDMVFVKQSQRQQDRIRPPVLQCLLQMFEQAFAGPAILTVKHMKLLISGLQYFQGSPVFLAARQHGLPCVDKPATPVPLWSRDIIPRLARISGQHRRTRVLRQKGATTEHGIIKMWRQNQNAAACLPVWRLKRAAHFVACAPTVFSMRKLPMASASSGEVKNASRASRGVQTMGRPRVLNEVLTRTGTPVRASKARNNS